MVTTNNYRVIVIYREKKGKKYLPSSTGHLIVQARSKGDAHKVARRHLHPDHSSAIVGRASLTDGTPVNYAPFPFKHNPPLHAYKKRSQY